MNVKLKSLNCNENICFDRACIEQNTPKRAQIKVDSRNSITYGTEKYELLCIMHLENASI
jgi:hypothetical protein